MKRQKTKLKRVKAASRLKPPRSRVLTTKLRKKKSHSRLAKAKPRATSDTSAIHPNQRTSRIVRIMGHGQLRIDSRTLKKLKQIDESLVEIVAKERPDAIEFRRRLLELSETATRNGSAIDAKEIVRSDVIIPSPDLGLEEAKKLFRGEGVIPAT